MRLPGDEALFSYVVCLLKAHCGVLLLPCESSGRCQREEDLAFLATCTEAQREGLALYHSTYVREALPFLVSNADPSAVLPDLPMATDDLEED
jgi:hypothetical protein